jgi:leucyl-tRNA synthetase
MKCNKKSILENVLILLSPYAPHISQELWDCLGNDNYVINATYPLLNKSYLVEDETTYPIAINGKRKMELKLPAEIEEVDAKNIVLNHDDVQKLISDKIIRKFIFVKGRMINIVV